MYQSPKILAVDDEESICYVLKLNLELAGFSVTTAHSGEEVLRMKRLEQYDLFLLDVMMEHIDGFELARRLRSDEKLRRIPIIFCTAKDSEDDLLKGFDNGADDYIKKPFSMKELVARVKSVLHRSGRLTTAGVLANGQLVLDLERRTCTIGHEEVQLTAKEFDLLAFFLSNPNKIFSRDEILNRVWTGGIYVVDRTIDVNVGRLRKKLGRYGSNIITKQGQGYEYQTDD